MTKLGKKIMAAVVLLAAFGPSSARACEMCWGAAVDNPITQGISMAMLVLVGMTGVLGGGIGAFFYHVQRRASMLERSDVVVTEYGDVRKVDESES